MDPTSNPDRPAPAPAPGAVAGESMRAVVQDRYGPPSVLEVRRVERPDPGRLTGDRVQVGVTAASLNALDLHLMTGTPWLVRPSAGLVRPKVAVRGADLAGVVQAVGPEVRGLAPGDRVFGTVGGSLAESVVTRAGQLCPTPDSMSDIEAAALPVAGITALEAVRDHGRVEAGHRVLINGAAGGVGTFAVQIAAALGAEVTAVCSTRNVDLARALGASRVIDYATSPTPVPDAVADGSRYDAVIDNVGNWPLPVCADLLADGGSYVMVSGPKGRILGPAARAAVGMVRFRLARRRFVVFVASESTEKLTDLAGLVDQGRLQPVVDRLVDLDETVAAMEYLATGHARAKIVIDVAGAGPIPDRARIATVESRLSVPDPVVLQPEPADGTAGDGPDDLR